jgi:hypothetical protein
MLRVHVYMYKALLIKSGKLQRRARRHATINVVDLSDVTTCQNMVDVSDVAACQNKHARVFCVCDVTDGRKDKNPW